MITAKRATKRQIYKACEALAKNRFSYSCFALERAVYGSVQKETSIACLNYMRFFGWKDEDDRQFIGSNYIYFMWSNHNERQTALLLYLEARDDV